jgi:hypothetical protein
MSLCGGGGGVGVVVVVVVVIYVYVLCVADLEDLQTSKNLVDRKLDDLDGNHRRLTAQHAQLQSDLASVQVRGPVLSCCVY